MPKFNGSIGITRADSISSHEPEERIPNSPNILYIVLDDVGFAQLGCYGSTINTPNIDRIAASGLRYNNFHTTAICSATRASLLTGANHHSVGICTVVDTLDGSYPSQTGCIDPHYATTAEVLKEYGYANFAVGKWHLAPFDECTEAGPFNNWPLGKGFDRFYGFMEGFTDQYTPDLVKDNEHILPPRSPEEGYHLSEDLADQAIKLLNRQNVIYPDRPFFLYFAPGAGHSPHQAPKEYIERYKGKFDCGWDSIRELWLENQKRLGIAPENAALNERNEFAKPWDELSEDAKKVFAKHMEVFAAFIEHADAQIGRLLDYLESSGKLDDTVIVLLSDNGASAEGGRNGRINQEKDLSLLEDNNNVELTLPHLDELGSSTYTNPHYPVGWANAGNTPFQWYKSWVHAGGVRDPLIVSWPNGIKARGEIRSQYLHVTDIAPTVLDILGVKKPQHIKGVPQQDYHGVSFKYTFDDAAAPDRRHTQYYEQTGNRGIWHDGWKAVTNHIRSDDFFNEEWELYNAAEDFSESENLAEKYPEKLKELVALWYAEAGKYGALPLGESPYLTKTPAQIARTGATPFFLNSQHFEYSGVLHPVRVSPKLMMRKRSHKISAEFTHAAGNEGILLSAGDRFGGYVLFVKDDRLCYVYNYHRERQYKLVSADALPSGKLRVEVQFIVDDFRSAASTARIFVNGKPQGEMKINGFIFMMETHVSLKDGVQSPVSDEFSLPFEYPAKLDRVCIDAASFLLTREQLLDEFFAVD